MPTVTEEWEDSVGSLIKGCRSWLRPVTYRSAYEPIYSTIYPIDKRSTQKSHVYLFSSQK